MGLGQKLGVFFFSFIKFLKIIQKSIKKIKITTSNYKNREKDTKKD